MEFTWHFLWLSHAKLLPYHYYICKTTYQATFKPFNNFYIKPMQPWNKIICLRVYIVRNHGMAYNSGINPMLSKWLNSCGSWKAIICENLARYSWMTALLSLKKNLCRYLSINPHKHEYARAERKKKNCYS